jgi:glycosyltransferase involved in cell wall biosynthesis
VNVCHFPANRGRRGRAPVVLTIHDALNFFPLGEQIRRSNRSIHRIATILYVSLATRLTYQAADAIVTGTAHARSDILARSPLSPKQIQITPWSGDPAFHRISDEAMLAEGRHRFKPRAHLIVADGIKNAGAVLAAYRQLPAALREETSVAFFSRERLPRPDVAGAIDDDAIRFLPRIATADLALLMNVASVFAFPSWYEGFGMPVVEAMQCGAPIVASTRGAIPELVADAGLLFEVDDVPTFARHLESIFASPATAADLRARSLARGRDFDWDRTARLTLDVYRSVASPR